MFVGLQVEREERKDTKTGGQEGRKDGEMRKEKGERGGERRGKLSYLPVSGLMGKDKKWAGMGKGK
jgi:hypothetical protein